MAANNNFQMSKRSPDNSLPSMLSMDAIMEAYIGYLLAVIPNFDAKVVPVMVYAILHRKCGLVMTMKGPFYDEFALAFLLFGNPRS
jgi:hypothetical protein